MYNEITRLENMFLETAKAVETKTTAESGGIQYAIFSGSKGAENLYDTPENMKPQSEAEWSVFNRQFANKTNGLKNGEEKNIMIVTGVSQYFIVADGYMSGNIISKVGIEDYYEGVEIYGTDRSTEISYNRNEKIGNRQRDISNNINSFENKERDSFDVELDEFIRTHSESRGSAVTSRENYKRKIKENWKKISEDGVKFSLKRQRTDPCLSYATKGKIKKVGQTEVNSLKNKGSGSHSNYNYSISTTAENVNNNSKNVDEQNAVLDNEDLQFSFAQRQVTDPCLSDLCLSNPNNNILYDKKAEPQGTDQLHKGLAGINDSASNNSLTQRKFVVNNKSMYENENNSKNVDEQSTKDISWFLSCL